MALTLAASLAVSSAAASRAMSDRRGSQTPGDPLANALAGSAYAVIDLRTQAVLDEQHGDWLDAPVWPGSIAKLATYTAAIEAGTLSDRTHIVCTRRLTLRDGRRVDCSHPPVAAAVSLREAVALSCNVFAADVARHLTAPQLAAGFARLGLPAPPADRDQTAIALGLDGVQIPPRQLLQALVYVVRLSDDSNEPADARTAARALLRAGLRDSARTGTASAFGRADIDAFAKTGTALMRNGRSLGLVVALAPAPSPRLGIVVALPGGAGADAADVAATLLRRRLASASQAQTRTSQAETRTSPAEAATPIRVGTPITGDGYRIENIPLEEYVARVVAGETSSATPQAAREALAITARTYTLANRGRHAADGFDLCTLTHCQVLRPASPASRDAAMHTRGRILTNDVGDPAPARAPAPVRAPAPARAPAPVFYSAACGGWLEDASTLLPNVRPGSMAWMTSRTDPAGVDEPRWHADLSVDDLTGALHAAGVRGETLRELRTESNATGHVTTVALVGLTPSVLDADDFRRIIGQRLGWQRLESPHFTVQRTARGYHFDGRGHGHGVGLCVFGASALARRGKTTDEILQAYFPGLRTVTLTDTAARASTAQPAIATLAIEVRLPASEERERASLRSQLEHDLRELRSALAGSIPPARVSLIVHPTGDSYRRATGRPWWTSAATMFNAGGDATIHMVPLAGLRRTGRLDATIRHEVAHALTASQLHGRPLWVQEGIAAWLAGEHHTTLAGVGHAADGDATAEGPDAVGAACPSDAELTHAHTPDAFQHAYARATACVARELARGVSWTSIGKPAR